MTKKTGQPLEPVRTVLTVSLEEARAKVYIQLDKGSQLAGRVEAIRNGTEFKAIDNETDRWLDYTRQLLESIANTNELSRQFSGSGVAFLSMRTPTLSEEIRELARTLERRLNILTSIYEKLELYPVEDKLSHRAQNPPTWENEARGRSASIVINNHGTIINPQIQQDSSRSTQTIGSNMSLAELLPMLDQLQKDIASISVSIPQEVATILGRDFQTLAEELRSEEPRKQWVELCIDDLKRKATDLGEIAAPILDTVNRMLPILAVLLGTHL